MQMLQRKFLIMARTGIHGVLGKKLHVVEMVTKRINNISPRQESTFIQRSLLFLFHLPRFL
ncbi:MAG: hypothetical protein DRQ02_10190 [Candidatus Latescibacterota bacterium]|nr:MAG: hypothetical protein DRQ02_10190 [Candidatus Latescibacterota bacterium]